MSVEKVDKNISDYVERKEESLIMHTSQYKKYGKVWLGAIKSRAYLRGYESSCNYAETFEVLRLSL